MDRHSHGRAARQGDRRAADAGRHRRAGARRAPRAPRRISCAARLGISGANALICETGTTMIVTNEGNAELVTSLPDVHVVLVGARNCCRRWPTRCCKCGCWRAPAPARRSRSTPLSSAAPTAPAKRSTTSSWTMAAARCAADPDFRDALRCIRCGACADVCPPYQVVGGHAFGYIYSGAIGLVNTPFHHGLANDAGPQSLCVSCNACATVCPVDIPLPRQILDVRRGRGRGVRPAVVQAAGAGTLVAARRSSTAPRASPARLVTPARRA